MPMGNLLENIHAKPFPEFHDAFLMAGRAKVAALAGEGQQVFMAATFAFDAGKAIVHIPAVEVTVNNLCAIRPPEAILSGEMIVIDLHKGLEAILHTAVIIRILRSAGMVCGYGQCHILSIERINAFRSNKT